MRCLASLFCIQPERSWMLVSMEGFFRPMTHPLVRLSVSKSTMFQACDLEVVGKSRPKGRGQKSSGTHMGFKQKHLRLFSISESL